MDFTRFQGLVLFVVKGLVCYHGFLATNFCFLLIRSLVALATRVEESGFHPIRICLTGPAGSRPMGSCFASC